MRDDGAIPQHDADNEHAVLGAALRDDRPDDALGLVLRRTAPEHFYLDACRRIRALMGTMAAAGDAIDLLTLGHALRRGGDEDALRVLPALFNDAAIPARLPVYVDKLIEDWRARRAAELGETLIAMNGAGGTERAVATIRLALADLEATPARSDVAVTSAPIDAILGADPVSLQTKYLAEPWIPDGGLCALSARWGAGKGKLVQALCVARATGTAWLGMPVAPGPALFWSGEQGRREDFRVTQAICRGHGLSAADFVRHFEVVHDPPVRFGHPTMVAHVISQLREHPGLLVVIDSLRRAFEGEERDSAAADHFYRTILVPLRMAGATVLLLGHPPKTGGQQRVISDENYLRGSGDWIAQLDSFMVLRQVNRRRTSLDVEEIVMRLTHVKPRSGPQAAPLLVTMRVTGDRTPLVAFTLTAKTADDADATAAATAGAVKAGAALFEERKRLGRGDIVNELQRAEHGRPAAEAAIKKLVELGVIRGPLSREEKRRGERGHWYIFLRPLPAEPGPRADDEPPAWVTDDPEEADLDP